MSVAIFGLCQEYKQEESAKRSFTYKMRLSMFEEMCRHRSVVMLGDSITARGEWSEFFNSSDIANRGVEGDNAQGMLGRVA